MRRIPIRDSLCLPLASLKFEAKMQASNRVVVSGTGQAPTRQRKISENLKPVSAAWPGNKNRRGREKLETGKGILLTLPPHNAFLR